MNVYMEIRISELVRQWLDSFPEDERPSQNEIAVRADMNPATLSHYMQDRARRPDPKVIARLCRVIGVTDMNEVFVITESDE